MSPASLAKRSFRTVEPVSRLRLSAAQTRHYPRCVCNVIFRSHRHELTNTTHDMNQKRSLFYSVVFMSKTIVFRKRYHELKMGHFGEIRLADPVFSAVVLPTDNEKEHKVPVYISLIPPKWCMAESTIKLGKVHVDTHQTMKCILVSFISALFVVYWYFVIMDENMFLEFGQFALWLALAGFASWNIS